MTFCATVTDNGHCDPIANFVLTAIRDVYETLGDQNYFGFLFSNSQSFDVMNQTAYEFAP